MFDFRSTPQAKIVTPQAVAAAPADFESWSQTVLVNGADRNDLTMYVTKRRWRAVDVYVQLPQSFFAGPIVGNLVPAVAVLVFARVGALRTLVGQGRLMLRDENVAKHVVSVRSAMAETFEIVFCTAGLAGSTIIGTKSVQVAVIASDEAGEADPMIGVVPAYMQAVFGDIPAVNQNPSAVLLVNNLSAGTSENKYRVHGFSAANLSTGGIGPRWLQFWDQTTNPVNNQFPLWSCPVPDATGGGQPFFAAPEPVRSYRFKFGIAVAVSSTANVLTGAAVGDVAYQVFYK